VALVGGGDGVEDLGVHAGVVVGRETAEVQVMELECHPSILASPPSRLRTADAHVIYIFHL
jgi:hypothetical protein